jgi:hypothetical protein
MSLSPSGRSGLSLGGFSQLLVYENVLQKYIQIKFDSNIVRITDNLHKDPCINFNPQKDTLGIRTSKSTWGQM